MIRKFCIFLFFAMILVGACTPANSKSEVQETSEQKVPILPQSAPKDNSVTHASDEFCKHILTSKGWNRWATTLVEEFGEPDKCSSESGIYFNDAGQIIGKIIMEWEGLTYTFKGKLPETTRRSIVITPGHEFTRAWFNSHREKFIDLGLKIDFETDHDSSSYDEEYISKIEYLNAFIRLKFNAENQLTRIEMSLAL